MRTVYLGTSEFAAAVLERLAVGRHRPVLVVSRPDRPRGRGRSSQAPPVARRARELALDLWQPERVDDEETAARVAKARPQAVVVCAFGALIREPLLSQHEILNVHPSLLPRWRGAAPIERAIMAGDDETGVSIMRLEAGLDSGPVCLARSEPIAADDTYGALAARLRELAGDLISAVLELMDRGGVPDWVRQDDERATYAAKIEPADRLLDPALDPVSLERRVRALVPHMGARVALADGSLLGVRMAALPEEPDGGGADPGGAAAQAGCLAGTGVKVSGGRLLLRCRTGTLELLEVQPPGGRPMTAAAYIRGHRQALA